MMDDNIDLRLGNSIRTAIITWVRWKNFGSYLQAYALQQILIQLGYPNHIIADDVILPVKPPRLERIKSRLIGILRYPFTIRQRFAYEKAQNESDTLFNEFKDRYMYIDEQSASCLSKCDEIYDQYVCGSDQIWSPLGRQSLEPFYYAGFSNKKKIAYAASFGVVEYPHNMETELKNLTRDFGAISCRETTGCDIIKKTLKKEALYVLDPTLLLPQKQWQDISQPPAGFDSHTQYVFVYFLSPNKWYINYAKRYAKTHSLKLVAVNLRLRTQSECDEMCIAGPSQFVWLINHAQIVFTDSFHGSIFAAQMHTPFIGFCRFQDGVSNCGQNHRLLDLYKLMGVYDRFIWNKRDCKRIPNLKQIDFNHIESSLAPMKDASISFLASSLK